MYLPSVLQPLAVAGPVPPGLEALAEAPFSVLRGRPGSYAAERLAGVLERWGRLPDCVWLRAGDAAADDVAPALAAACRYRWRPDHPEPATTGGLLEDELAGAPEGAVLVLELSGRAVPTAARLARRLRPLLADRRVSVLAVTQTRWTWPGTGPGGRGLDLGRLPAPALTDDLAPLTALLDRHGLAHRSALLLDLHAVARAWSPAPVVDAVRQAHSLSSALEALSTDLVGRLDPAHRTALEVALGSGYWHPQLGTEPVAAQQLRPWLVPLEQGWGGVRPVWARPLRRALARVPAGAPTTAPATTRATARATTRASAAAAVPAPSRPGPHGLLEVRLLGSLEVRLDGVPVESWRGQRGVSVLRYLLSRDRHACSRDELLEEFWPDVPAAAARNRLQVAVSGLRRALLDVTRVNVVEFADGGYRINPALRVEVDCARFEQVLRAASAAEQAGDRGAALAGYREAARLYRGDFAADVPFEQWTLLPRESLRIRLVDALDRLSRLELADGRLDDCIGTAQRMLELDPCREDAHRLLMRCYAEQGRVYRALQQYDFCTRVLRATVDVGPAAETRRLHDLIRTSTA